MRQSLVLLLSLVSLSVFSQSKALVFQTDFGLNDGAVSAMKGVAYSVDNDLAMFDITHEIPAYNIWEAAYRLKQTAPYWPPGTVFVSVVDPGVGTTRKSIVLKTKTGHFVVTPDNGTVTLISEIMGVAEVREIDEAKNRLKNSNESYTFHGRDVYSFTGARLASGIISFEEVGPVLQSELVKLEYQKPKFENEKITGAIEILDVQYGNLWTNIDKKLFERLGVNEGQKVQVRIFEFNKKMFDQEVVFGKTFGSVPQNAAIVYINSLLNVAVGINQGSFADRFNIGSGAKWRIELSR